MSEHAASRPAGFITIDDPDRGLIHADTLQCVHCGGHWRVQPGSGKIRGFCARCNGPVCGPACAKCVPVEQFCENVEAGRPHDWRPIMVGWEPGQR